VGKTFSAKVMERDFIQYVNSGNFPDLAVEWHEYDYETQQVFLWVEGEWNSEVKCELQEFLKKYNRRVLVSTMAVTDQTLKD